MLNLRISFEIKIYLHMSKVTRKVKYRPKPQINIEDKNFKNHDSKEKFPLGQKKKKKNSNTKPPTKRANNLQQQNLYINTMHTASSLSFH